MIVSYMVVWLEISTAAPIALRLEFGNARVMPWTWQSFTANAVCGPSEGCLIIFGGIVLMPRVISSTVALAMFLQHEHHLREAADYIPIDQLGTTDDCGFVPSVGPAAFFRQRPDRRREGQELPARPP